MNFVRKLLNSNTMKYLLCHAVHNEKFISIFTKYKKSYVFFLSKRKNLITMNKWIQFSTQFQNISLCSAVYAAARKVRDGLVMELLLLTLKPCDFLHGASYLIKEKQENTTITIDNFSLPCFSCLQWWTPHGSQQSWLISQPLSTSLTICLYLTTPLAPTLKMLILNKAIHSEFSEKSKEDQIIK